MEHVLLYYGYTLKRVTMIELLQASVKESQSANSLTTLQEDSGEQFLSILHSKLTHTDEIDTKIVVKLVDSKVLVNKENNPQAVLEKLLHALGDTKGEKSITNLLKTIGLDEQEVKAVVSLLKKEVEANKTALSTLEKLTTNILEKNEIKADLEKVTETKNNGTRSKDVSPLEKIIKSTQKVQVDDETKVKTADQSAVEASAQEKKPIEKSVLNEKQDTPIVLEKNIKKAETTVADEKQTNTVVIEKNRENKEHITENRSHQEHFQKDEPPLKNIEAITKIFSYIKITLENAKQSDQNIIDNKNKIEEKSVAKAVLNEFSDNISEIDVKKLEDIKKDISAYLELTKKIKVPKSAENVEKSVEQIVQKLFAKLEPLVDAALKQIQFTPPAVIQVKKVPQNENNIINIVEHIKDKKVSPKSLNALQMLLSLPESKQKEKIIKTLNEEITQIENVEKPIEKAVDTHFELFKNTPILQIQKETTSVNESKNKTDKDFISEKLIQLVPKSEHQNFSTELISKAKQYLEQQLNELQVQKEEKPTLATLVKLAMAKNIDVEEITLKDITPKENLQKMVDNLFNTKVVPLNVRQAQSGHIMISRERSSGEKVSKTSTHTTPLAQLLNPTETSDQSIEMKPLQTALNMQNVQNKTNSSENLAENIETITSQNEREHSDIGVKHDTKVETGLKNHESTKQMISYFSASLKEAVQNYRPPFQRLHIKLNPEKLGSVEVTLVQRGQQLHINISANSTALNMMNAQSGELKMQLQNIGLGDASMEFNQQQENHKEQQQEQQQRQPNRFTNYLDNNEEETPISSLELIMANYF